MPAPATRFGVFSAPSVEEAPASDLVIALLAQKNSGGHGATASVSPAAGGVLIATVTTNAQGVVWTPAGTLTGTWTKVASAPDAGQGRSNSIWTCPDYGASGTVAFTPDGGTWTQVGIYHASSATGQLVITGVIGQTKLGVQAVNPSVAWDTPPVYGTFAYIDNPNAFVPGTGWTQLINNGSFDVVASMWSQPGAAPIAYTCAQASTLAAIELVRT